MNNISKITNAGMCVGCGECSFCEHISFQKNAYGVPTPIVDATCTNCGECLNQCTYNPYNAN